MSIEIKVPDVGESIREVRIERWLKADGQNVERDAVVAVLETDKATVDLSAPAAGTLGIVKAEGESAQVGEVIATLEESEAGSDRAPAAAGGNATAGNGGAGEVAPGGREGLQAEDGLPMGGPQSVEAASASQEETQEPEGPQPEEDPAIPPERLVEELENPPGEMPSEYIEPPSETPPPPAESSPKASGAAEHSQPKQERENRQPPHPSTAPEDGLLESEPEDFRERSAPVPGKPHKEPIVAASTKGSKGGRAPAPETTGSRKPGNGWTAVPERVTGSPERREERVPMSPLRRKVAENLVKSQKTAALLTTFNEIDMTRVQDLRRRFQSEFEKRHGVRLGLMSFFVKACVEALQEIPRLNAEIREKDVVYKHYCDIGVAIAGDKGLVVPVLRNAERMGFAQIESAIADFAQRARNNTLRLDELQGGTFTISNGGVFGSLFSTPIVNPPQSGVLGMHAVQERPVAWEGMVVIRPMMYVALTYDHRIVDGKEAVTFLRRIKEAVEDPERMLVGV